MQSLQFVVCFNILTCLCTAHNISSQISPFPLQTCPDDVTGIEIGNYPAKYENSRETIILHLYSIDYTFIEHSYATKTGSQTSAEKQYAVLSERLKRKRGIWTQKYLPFHSCSYRCITSLWWYNWHSRIDIYSHTSHGRQLVLYKRIKLETSE